MRLPQRDSATGRGLATVAQAIIGFGIGLFTVVWAVPGVPDAVINYVQGHIVELAIAFGISAGAVSSIWNWFRPNIKNY